MAGSAHTWVDGDAPNTSFMNALPRGVMGYVVGATADQASISAAVDITGLTVTFTAISTRLYRTMVVVNVSQQTSTGAVAIVITDGAAATKQTSTSALAATFEDTITVVSLETGLSGSTTRKARASTTAGTCTVKGAAGRVGTIIVEDLGPA